MNSSSGSRMHARTGDKIERSSATKAKVGSRRKTRLAEQHTLMRMSRSSEILCDDHNSVTTAAAWVAASATAGSTAASAHTACHAGPLIGTRRTASKEAV